MKIKLITPIEVAECTMRNVVVEKVDEEQGYVVLSSPDYAPRTCLIGQREARKFRAGDIVEVFQRVSKEGHMTMWIQRDEPEVAP